MKGFVTAVRSLSILPIPGRDADDTASSLPWFPLVGCLLGLIVYGLYILGVSVTGGKWPEGVAVLLLAGGTIITRGFHLDGLSDLADGFGGARDRDRVLEIMKDSSTGTFGVLALIVICAAKWVCFVKLISTGAAIWIVAAYIVSRAMQVDLAASLSYARPEGGTGSPFINGATRRHAVISILSAMVLLIIFCGSAGLTALVLGWATARILGMWYMRRLGGATGDLLGATSEIVETGVLILAATLRSP